MKLALRHRGRTGQQKAQPPPASGGRQAELRRQLHFDLGRKATATATAPPRSGVNVHRAVIDGVVHAKESLGRKLEEEDLGLVWLYLAERRHHSRRRAEEPLLKALALGSGVAHEDKATELRPAATVKLARSATGCGASALRPVWPLLRALALWHLHLFVIPDPGACLRLRLLRELPHLCLPPTLSFLILSSRASVWRSTQTRTEHPAAESKEKIHEYHPTSTTAQRRGRACVRGYCSCCQRPTPISLGNWHLIGIRKQTSCAPLRGQ